MAPGQPVTADIFYGFPLFTAATALLAFLLAFYALAARERKTPYIVASVFLPVLVILASVFVGFLAMATKTILPSATAYLAGTAIVVLVASLVQIMYLVLKVHNRQAHFRDDNMIINLPAFQWIKSIKRRLSKKPSYTHDPVKFADELNRELNAVDVLKGKIQDVLNESSLIWREQNSVSLSAQRKSHNELDTLLVQMALAFLRTGNHVQYATASRHPIEFVRKLKQAWEKTEANKDWKEIAPNIVVVDAYTPHFGFTDSTHGRWSARLEQDEAVQMVTSAPTYAGVHTATAKAFNLIKEKRDEALPRRPSMVIYEGMYALSDIESVEQYRIFIRHVIPSERLWGGMFTVIAETTIPEGEMALVRSYSHLNLLDRRECPVSDSTPQD